MSLTIKDLRVARITPTHDYGYDPPKFFGYEVDYDRPATVADLVEVAESMGGFTLSSQPDPEIPPDATTWYVMFDTPGPNRYLVIPLEETPK